uniref:Exocyst complex component EXO70B1 n=1 Tax=Rhizophora mucronata TaxID=61149 RepID=A0A2P2R134_RHIMU
MSQNMFLFIQVKKILWMLAQLSLLGMNRRRIQFKEIAEPQRSSLLMWSILM